jgi:hypothetical protein
MTVIFADHSRDDKIRGERRSRGDFCLLAVIETEMAGEIKRHLMIFERFLQFATVLKHSFIKFAGLIPPNI